MPIPWDMLNQTATIAVQLSEQQSSGAWENADAVTYTAMCCLQPNSSGDASVYKRETGTTLYTLFLGPLTTSGAAISGTINKIAKVTIDSVVYGVDGELIDLCSNGVCFQLNLWRNT
jgi:hypothetical protein